MGSQCFPIHVDEVPEYQAVGGNMRIRWREVELFVPMHICQIAMARCEAAMREWRIDQSGKIDDLDHWRGAGHTAPP